MCKDMKRERRLQSKIQGSLKEDLWFGKGVASALTKLVLESTAHCNTVVYSPQYDG